MSSDTSINSRLPENCFLAYVISHETWYRNVINGREITICAESRGGGVAWEMKAEEVALGGKTAVRLCVFDDAFAAFAQVPGLFEALGALSEMERLEDLVAVLDRVGAQDITERVEPGRVR